MKESMNCKSLTVLKVQFTIGSKKQVLLTRQKITENGTSKHQFKRIQKRYQLMQYEIKKGMNQNEEDHAKAEEKKILE